MIVKFKKLDRNAKIPKYMSDTAAGMDLYTTIKTPVCIHPGGLEYFPTGLAMEMTPEEKDGNTNFAAFVFGRSGLGCRHGIHPANAVGVIDSDYRGEITVGLCNVSKRSYIINPGDRIAQLVIMPVITPTAVIETETLSDTERGKNGFGSTGKE